MADDVRELRVKLGDVSAYLDAVKYGDFKGTREEFGRLLGNGATFSENAEAWSVGQRNGEDVPETDPTYHNNAKYYAEQAAGSETAAGESAAAAAGSATDASGSATAAAGSATAAEGSATAAEASASMAASFVGAPLTASTVAGMTDQSRIYVYVGSETGYTSGDWYYWNGTAWTDGGVYLAAVVDIASSADVQEALYS